MDVKYDYTFAVWPDETNPRVRAYTAIFCLFRHMNTRSTMEFTEREFNDFREELFKVGLTLREIERVPHCDPETVV